MAVGGFRYSSDGRITGVDESKCFWFRLESGSQASAFPTSYRESSMPWDRSPSSQGPSRISPLDSSLRGSRDEAHYRRPHTCSQRASSDPPAQPRQVLSFVHSETAETASPNPGETGSTPGSEEGGGPDERDRGFPPPCPERRKTVAPEILLGERLWQREDSGSVSDWNTERGKLEKEEAGVFKAQVDDARPSPAGVACPGGQHGPEVMRHAKTALHTNFIPDGSKDVSGESSGTDLTEKQRVAGGRECSVENDDSADGVKDEWVKPPEDTSGSKHIGKDVFSAGYFQLLTSVMHFLCFLIKKKTTMQFAVFAARGSRSFILSTNTAINAISVRL